MNTLEELRDFGVLVAPNDIRSPEQIAKDLGLAAVSGGRVIVPQLRIEDVPTANTGNEV